MTKKYTEEHRQFLRDFIPGHSCIEVSEEFNRRFEIKITPSQVHSYKTNYHIKSGTKGVFCNTASVTETEIEKTFVNMYNRLKQNEWAVLQTAFSQLTALKKRITIGRESIGEMDREIASLSDENSMYIRFFQQGMVDEITFREQTGVVNKRINELRARRQKLLHEDGDEACVELLREGKEQLAEMPDAILWFDREIFRRLVAKIFVISKTALMFELKCGLRFKEDIVWD